MTESRVTICNQALSRIGYTKFIASPDENSPAARICDLHWANVIREVLEQRLWSFARFEATLSRIDNQSVTYDDTTNPATDAAQTKFPVPFDFLTAGQLAVTLDDVAQVLGTDYTVTTTSGYTPFITMTTAPGAAAELVITLAAEREGWTYLFGLPSNFVSPVALLWDGTRHDVTPEANRMQFAVLASESGQNRILACNEEAADFKLEYVGYIDRPEMWPATFRSAVTWRLAAELAAALSKENDAYAKAYKFYLEELSRASARDANSRQSQRPMTPSLQSRGQADEYNDNPPFRWPE